MQQLIKAVKKPKPNCGLQMDFTRLWKYTTVCDWWYGSRWFKHDCIMKNYYYKHKKVHSWDKALACPLHSNYI